MTLAILVCTRNRATSLANCLSSIAALDLDVGCPVRLVIVDNSDTEAARDANRAAISRSRLPIPVEVVIESQPGLSFVRNRALDVAADEGCEWIVFLDDDQSVPADWLGVMLAVFRETGADVVKSAGIELPAEMFVVDHGGIEPPRARPRDFETTELGTNGVLISRRVFADAGLRFDPAFALTSGEDHDFFYRARAVGATLVRTYETYAIEWVPKRRRTLVGNLERGFRNGNVSALLRHHRQESGTRVALRGIWLSLSAAILFVPMLWRAESRRRMAQRLGKGAGLMFGVAGHRFLYYRTGMR